MESDALAERGLPAKNFFQHRYDYRAEWIRFTDTIGRPGTDSAPFHERVIKAIADITDSPGGILLMPDDSGQLMLQSRWNWSSIHVPARACTARTIAFFEDSILSNLTRCVPIRTTNATRQPFRTG